jgi:signal transduction histidine kinase
MSPVALIPAAAALLCLEVAIVFAVLYAKVTHRRADLAFGAVALCLAYTRWTSMTRRHAPDLASGLLWLRLEWVVSLVTLAVFLYFAAVALNRTPGPVQTALGLAALVGLARLPWWHGMIAPPPAAVDPADLERLARGDFLSLVVGLMLLGALGALWLLFSDAQRPRDTTLSPIARHRHHLLWAGLVVIAAPPLVLVSEYYSGGPDQLSIQSWAALAFCLIIGRALAKEVLRIDTEKRHQEDLALYRSQAVRDVAHELKNPLAAIQMATQTLLAGVRDGLEPTEQCQILEMCLSACRRLTRMINNMLDTARMEAGRDLEIRAESTDLAALAASVVTFQQSTTVKHHLLLQAEVATPVVRVDADKLHQVLTNLR